MSTTTEASICIDRIDSGLVRVGNETRDCRFTDQHIRGWTFQGRDVVIPGEWTGRPWPAHEIAEYDQRLARYRRVRWLRFLRHVTYPVAQWADEHFPSTVAGAGKPSPLPGWRGWVGRTGVSALARRVDRALQPPEVLSVSIRDCNSFVARIY